MIAIDIRPDLKGLQRAFVNLRAKQAPFATALALNNLAKGIVQQERDELSSDFKKHTPFTDNAFRIEVATKNKPIAVVAAKDIQASYLEPYVFGGDRSLGTKKGMLSPITQNLQLNQYGNIPRGKLQSLKGKPGVFIGPVKTKAGIINGVWRQRPSLNTGRRGTRGMAGIDRGGKLDLLIKFTNTSPVPHRFNFFGRARSYIKANAAREFDAAMRRAFATAKPR
jgi:hypothetical protein